MTIARSLPSAAPALGQRLNPLAPWAGVWRHRALLRELVVRDVQTRYRGSYLGLLWSLLTPLATIAVYTFVFGFIFNARFEADASPPRAAFPLVLFCGLIPYAVFSESVSRAPGLIVHNPQYVKKVVFPLELLPVVSLASSLFHAAISIVILLVGTLVFAGSVSATLLLFPLVAVPLLLLCLGASWLVSSLGVFIRDVGHSVGIGVQLLLFATPIFYPLSAVPAGFAWVMRLNPLTTIVEGTRATLLWGQPPDWGAWVVVTAGCLLFAQLAYAWFMTSRKAFADVL